MATLLAFKINDFKLIVDFTSNCYHSSNFDQFRQMTVSELSNIVHYREFFYFNKNLGKHFLIGLMSYDSEFVSNFIQLRDNELGLQTDPHCNSRNRFF